MRLNKVDFIRKSLFILGLILLAVGIVLRIHVLFFISLLIGICFISILYFFRNPQREVSCRAGTIISPADGIIVHIGITESRHFKEKQANKVSIFLTLWDVHVNRIPVSGRVLWKEHHKGSYYPAFSKKASIKNEYSVIALDSSIGMVIVKQISGLLIRRIICHIQEGAQVKQGDPYGRIVLGSRVELLFPASVTVTVLKGEHVKAGETIIGVVDNGT